MEYIRKPLTLKCGLTLSNRLVKAAMAEQMADCNGLPHERFYHAYSQWADGGWGMILTGNVFVDPAYLGMRHELSIPPVINAEAKNALARYHQSCASAGIPTLVQLNHAGRQSAIGAGKRSIFAKTIAPSPIPLNLGEGLIPWAARVILFGTPREMTSVDIEKVIGQFVHSAVVVAKAGFEGVELHAAHGYLLSGFLSKKTNLRQDKWGGDAAGRVLIVTEIIKRIRLATPSGLAIGVKLNSADHQNDQAMEEALIQVQAIVDAGVDFVEISGGTWEDPQMMQPDSNPITSARTKAREAFFLSFSSAIRSHFQDIPLMVTGGFRSRGGMARAITNGDCDLIGLARPAVLNPKLPKNRIFNEQVGDDDRLYTATLEKPFLERLIGNRIVGAGAESTWYSRQIQQNGIRERVPPN